MKRIFPSRRNCALALWEVLVVVTIMAVLGAFYLTGVQHRNKGRSQRIACIGRLKQMGLSFRIWAGDNKDLYPMSVPGTNGGTMEFTTGPNVWRHFQVMSNELNTPMILICPAESDPGRSFADTFGVPEPRQIAFTGNSNLSYFVAPEASDIYPAMLLSGDDNFTNTTPVIDHVMTVVSNDPVGWKAIRHGLQGNIMLADGSVQSTGMLPLRNLVNNTGWMTNRVQMP